MQAKAQHKLCLSAHGEDFQCCAFLWSIQTHSAFLGRNQLLSKCYMKLGFTFHFCPFNNGHCS